MDPDQLSAARIRPARSAEDIARAEEFLRTPRVREIIETHPEERGCVRLCETNGELIAALLIDPTPLRIRDTEIRCARLHETGGEDGRSHFRRTGDRELFEFLMEEFLGYLWARRYPIAYVHGELALFPGQGFVPCFYHPRVYVDVAAALRLPAPYRVRRFKSDDAKRLPELRRQYRLWKPQVFANGVRRFHHFSIENKEREFKGCFSLEIDAEARWNPRFFAPEVDVADRAAACSVLRHCAEQAKELGLREFHFPLGPGHPVARLCLELGGTSVLRGAATDPRLNEEMVQIADPARLSESLAPYFEKRLSIGGFDGEAAIPFLTDHGQWMLEIGQGTALLTGINRRPMKGLHIPHWMFSQLLIGYRSVDELDIDIDDNTHAILRLLFPKTWPFSMPDADHWTTRAPPHPYSREALAVVDQVTLPWAPGRTSR